MEPTCRGPAQARGAGLAAALHPSAWEWAHAHADVLETHDTRGQPANPGEKTSRPKRDQISIASTAAWLVLGNAKPSFHFLSKYSRLDFETLVRAPQRVCLAPMCACVSFCVFVCSARGSQHAKARYRAPSLNLLTWPSGRGIPTAPSGSPPAGRGDAAPLPTARVLSFGF